MSFLTAPIQKDLASADRQKRCTVFVLMGKLGPIARKDRPDFQGHLKHGKRKGLHTGNAQAKTPVGLVKVVEEQSLHIVVFHHIPQTADALGRWDNGR